MLNDLSFWFGLVSASAGITGFLMVCLMFRRVEAILKKLAKIEKKLKAFPETISDEFVYRLFEGVKSKDDCPPIPPKY